MTNNRSFALPFFVTGLGAGIALAALLTPRSGAATRRLIGRKVEEGKEYLTSQFAAGQDYLRSQGAELRERFKEVDEVIRRPWETPAMPKCEAAGIQERS